MSNAIYKKDLHDVVLAVAQGSKNYTDNSIEKLKWELGTYDLSVTTDSTVAYTKTIPTNTIKGRLNYIGGASKVSENLIVLNDVAERTVNGITYKCDKGIITISGTATATTVITFNFSKDISLSANSYVLFTFNKLSTSYNSFIWLSEKNVPSSRLFLMQNTATVTTTFNAPHTLESIKINLTNGETFNATLKPMLVSGSTAPTEFSEGFENIRSAKTTSVVVSGNLISSNDVSSVETSYGVTYSISNGVISLRGTCSTTGSFSINLSNNIPLGQYYFKVFADNYAHRNGVSLIPWADANSCGNINEGQIVNVTSNRTAIAVYVSSGTNYNNATIKPMLISGSTAPTIYKPYIAPITKAIPSEIQALEGYGQSNPEDSTKFNYIDFDKKIYVELGYIDENDEWQELATPVETDISQYIDDEFKNIDTTDMTTATFENEFEYDVPSEIDYLIEEVKA